MQPIIYGYSINVNGEIQEISKIPQNKKSLNYCWFHINASSTDSIEWLSKIDDIPKEAIEMLLSKNTRPNVLKFDSGTLLTLRAVNSNAEENIEDFNAINIWISDKQIITVRSIKILAIEDLKRDFEIGRYPTNRSEFIFELIHHLQERINDVVMDIEETSDTIEEQLLMMSTKETVAELISLRKKVVQVRRYIVPQRDSLQQLNNEKMEFLSENDKYKILYYYEKIVRLIENLDIVRERVLLNQEELSNNRNDVMNRSMYRISIISGLFLPLGFVTGLLGVNIGGMPGVDNSKSFYLLVIFSGLYLLLTSFYFVLKKRF